MKKVLMSLALLAGLAVCAFPAAAADLLPFVGASPGVAAPALLLATGVAAVVADAERKPQVGDLVVFYAGDHDPAFVAGSRLDAEIVHVWTESCVNVLITDAAGESHSRTSVRLVAEGTVDVLGHYATLKADQAETATG